MFLLALLALAGMVVVPSLLRARRSPGMVHVVGDLRSMEAGQRAYHSQFGHYGPPECLRSPRECHPEYTGPHFLEAAIRVDQEWGGYRYRFHPGRAAGPKRLEGWAFAGEALQPHRRSYCVDASGVVCVTHPEPERWGGLAGGEPRAPQVTEGRCAPCEPLR